MIRGQLAQRAQQLTADRVPFVLATVVRARQPTSVRAGDSAIVLGDGTIDGFVGGTCATSSVRLHSLRALETGEAVLLRLVPDDGGFDPEAADGTVVVEHNPCLSGGALEIFLEPQLPAARFVVVGETPIARAFAEIAAAAGYDVCAGRRRSSRTQVQRRGSDRRLAWHGGGEGARNGAERRRSLRRARRQPGPRGRRCGGARRARRAPSTATHARRDGHRRSDSS